MQWTPRRLRRLWWFIIAWCLIFIGVDLALYLLGGSWVFLVAIVLLAAVLPWAGYWLHRVTKWEEIHAPDR